MRMIYVGYITTTSNTNITTFTMKKGINLVYVTAAKVAGTGTTAGDFVFGSSGAVWRTLNTWHRFTVTEDSVSERVMPGTGSSTTYNGFAVIILNFPF